MGLADDLLEKMYQWIRQREECADKLEELARELETTRKDCNIAECVGNSVSVAGAACMAGAGVATLLTGGAAAPVFVGIAAAVGSGVGVAVTVGTKITEHFMASDRMKEAKEIEKRSNETTTDIQRLSQRLKDKIEEENPSADPDQLDQLFMFSVVKAAARLNSKDCSITFSDFNRLVPTNGTLSLQRNSTLVAVAGVLEFFAVKLSGKKISTLLSQGRVLLLKKLSSIGLKTAFKGGAMVVGGVVGLAFALPEAIDSWKEMIEQDHVTKASQSLRDTARDLREMSRTLRDELDGIKVMLEEMVRQREEEEKIKMLEEMARQREEEEKRKMLEEMARQREEEEKRKMLEEMARQREEEEKRKMLEEMARQREEEKRKMLEEIARQREEEEKRKMLEEMARQREEEKRKMLEEMARQREEEEKSKMLEEMARQREEEERRNKRWNVFQTHPRKNIAAPSRDAPGLMNTRNALILIVIVMVYLGSSWRRTESPERNTEQSAVTRTGPLKIGLLKVQSLSYRMSSVPELVSKHHLDVFLTVGTRIQQETAYQVLQEASPQNFSFYFQAENRGQDAVTVQFSEQLLDDLLVCDFVTTFQCVMTELRRPGWKQPLLLITVYRASAASATCTATATATCTATAAFATAAWTVFLAELQELLDQVSECYESVLLSGDFLQQSSDQIKDLLRTNQLVQHGEGVVFSRNVEISSLTVNVDADSHQYATFSAKPQP